MGQKKKRRSFLLRLFVILIAAGFLTAGGINLFVVKRAEKSIETWTRLTGNKQKKADAVIVLGAKVRKDGRMSLMLKERVDMGIAAYKQGLADRIIMSGDHGTQGYDEVSTMKAYAVEQGVPSKCVFKDHAGFSTYETMYRARDIFQAKNVIVITQKYHLYRAVYDAQALGLQVKGAACDKAVYKGDKARKFREAIARIKDFGYTVVKPKPKFLGKAIPVNGNGDVTE
ncbi:SanA/YdcF family protein [Anaerostipes sp.]|uniref:SanA/YdcF family protein n=1 Tax=Anaerostipes sp. TaxID=1872530 RepID=UPI0025C45071|nr:ElyC/SanA/YdcF family protein [Anaerostipes sp.]MBS7009777.1 YdcF family protein [Anaerostipes sp.]